MTTFISIYTPLYALGRNGAGGVTFTKLSMPHLLVNHGRAIQSGWKLQIQVDGSFSFCEAELGVIVFGLRISRKVETVTTLRICDQVHQGSQQGNHR